MTPTLEGRLQTRLALAATVGAVWTAIISPFLPEPAGVTVLSSYAMAYASLLLMAVYGLVWEYLYHQLQQRRWDKDWPSVFGLLSVLNEAPLVWILDHLFPVMSGPMAGMSGSAATTSGSLGLASPYLVGFVIHIGTTWMLIWLCSQGPMRVIAVRWRFNGGRFGAQQCPERRLEAPGPTFQPGYGQAWPDGGLEPAARDALQGVMCGRGHFNHPRVRYCMTCGRPLLPQDGKPAVGRRLPLGILIFEDGATHVVEEDVSVRAEESGRLTAGSDDHSPDAPALADIRLSGWDSLVSSKFHRIAMELPGGQRLYVSPGVPTRLVSGAEFTVARHRIRYESPYHPAELSRPADDSLDGASPPADATAPVALAAIPGQEESA